MGAVLLAGSLLTWAVTGAAGLQGESLRALPRLLLALGLISVLVGLGKRWMII